MYVQLAQKLAHSFDDIFDCVQSINRSDYIPPQSPIIVQVQSHSEKRTSAKTIQSISHKAIITSLTGDRNTNRTIDDQQTPIEVYIHIHDLQVSVYINTSGHSLHERGYRSGTGDAPLKENLAAAMILSSNWDFRLPLYDPFCGSGTILIEAAMIARNMAPGIRRSYIFQYFKNYDSIVREKLKEQAIAKQFTKSYVIVGSDTDTTVLEKAEYNAQAAGVADTIQREHKDFHDQVFQPNAHCLTNPPYGIRLQQDQDLIRDVDAMFHNNNLTGGYIIPESKDVTQANTKDPYFYNGAQKIIFKKFKK